MCHFDTSCKTILRCVTKYYMYNVTKKNYNITILHCYNVIKARTHDFVTLWSCIKLSFLSLSLASLLTAPYQTNYCNYMLIFFFNPCNVLYLTFFATVLEAFENPYYIISQR